MMMRMLPVLLAVLAGILPARVGHAEGDATPPDRRVVVYYLYKTPRCDTCLRIEAYSKEALDSSFAGQLEAGSIEWHAYDTDLPEYAHYWSDFKLEVKSLVMVEVQGSEIAQWKICPKVWDLVDDKPAFLDYVRSELESYLHQE